MRLKDHTFLMELIENQSEVGKQLADVFHTSLRSYLTSMIQFARQSEFIPTHRSIVINLLAQQLNEWGVIGSDRLCANLEAFPIIQQADHSFLLFDEETFLNNYLFHIACRENSIDTMLTWQCSTVSPITRRNPLRGPAFVRTRSNLYKVLSLSNRQLTHATVCCLSTPQKLSFERIEGNNPMDTFLAHFVGRTIPNVPDGYRECNDDIWSSLRMQSKTRRFAVDEFLSSRIVAQHIVNKNSPVHRLVFNPQVRDTFLRIKREMVGRHEFYCVNRSLPDFFWYRRKRRLKPMMIIGKSIDAKLQVESHNPVIDFDYTPNDLNNALINGQVYPNKFLIYLVRCILPRIVAVGGTAQQDYLAMYLELLRRTQAQAPFLEPEDVQTLHDFTASRLGGSILVELNEKQRQILQHLGPSSNLDEFEKTFINKPIGQTIGNLNGAWFYHKEFKRRQRHFPLEEIQNT
jgi:hypothetical protein